MAREQLSLVKTRVRRVNRLRLGVPITEDTTGRDNLPRRSCHEVGLENGLTIMGEANREGERVVEATRNAFPDFDRLAP